MSSKGSRFRKILFSFPISGDVRFHRQVSNRLILEVNSFANPFPFESQKIRHFYDIYYLFRDQECLEYLHLSESGSDLNDLIKHDKETFDEPTGWAMKRIQDSPILIDFNGVWQKLKNQYRTELSALAYSEIPEESKVEKTFEQVLALLFYHED